MMFAILFLFYSEKSIALKDGISLRSEQTIYERIPCVKLLGKKLPSTYLYFGSLKGRGRGRGQAFKVFKLKTLKIS